MFKFLLVCAIVASAFADVAHLRPKFTITPYRPPVRTPFVPIPVVARQNYQPISTGPQIAILRQTSDISPDGSYQYAYETENGINAEEQASVRAVGPEDAIKSAQGQFSWTSPEGELVSVSYVADENGYQPQGSHLPVAPPVPPQILRALEYIAAHPQAPEGVQYNRKY